MNKKLSKRLVVATSLVMFLIGAILGALAIWQFLNYRPHNISLPLKYACYIASGLFFGLVLFFSAKPVLFLMSVIGDALKKAFGRTNSLDVAAMFLGVSIGLMITYLADALINLVLKIVVARVAIDIVIGLSSSILAILLCAKFLNSREEEVDAPMFSGYLLAYSAFNSVKIVSICKDWLSANIFVLSGTIDTLIENAAQNGGVALQNYHALTKANLIKTINSSAINSPEDIVGVAERRGLKIIAENSEEFDNKSPIVTVLGLDTL